ncbi:MAG TPA: hypothetical protein VJ842_07510 [Pyrinomonadaceae bacterium]|nr:hypothetical protein [Pyrinomonadaceae bacterium]
MARSTTTAGGRKKGNRRMTLLWIAVAAAIIIALIWTEQVALLYVLATLSVTGLLLIVAFADLGGARQRALTEPAPNDDSAAAADGLGASSPAARTTKRR